MLYDLNGRAVFVKNNLLSMREILRLAACFFFFFGVGLIVFAVQMFDKCVDRITPRGEIQIYARKGI